MGERWLSKSELPKKLGVGKNKIDEFRKDHDFPLARKVGSTLKFVESEVDEWMRTHWPKVKFLEFNNQKS